MRLFAAIELSENARNAIAAVQKQVASMMAKSDAAMKWARPDQIHLTLAFIGEVDASHVSAIVEAGAPPIAVEPFTVAFGGLGVFPPRGAPRVLWLGVASGASQIVEVRRIVGDRLTRAGVALEARPFHPHLTLARWKASRRADARRAVAADRGGTIARTVVDSVTLFESRVSSAGSTYTALARTPLGGAAEQPLQ